MAEYKVVKDGKEIKTCKSMNAAKKAAVSAGAEVFCDGKCVYPEKEMKEQAVPDPVERKHYTLKALMNVRENPDLSAKVLTTIKTGTKVTVLDITDDWLKIEYETGTAYVLYGSGKYAQEGE